MIDGRIVKPFSDGVIIQHPDETVYSMVSLEESGAYWLRETQDAVPLSLCELARIMNQWFIGLDVFMMGFGIFSFPDDRFKTTFLDPNGSGSELIVWDTIIRHIGMGWDNPRKGVKDIEISEAAEILKEWYSKWHKSNT